MSGSLTNGLSNNTGTVVGSGSDAITLLMSGDAYGPAGAPGADAQFTLNVDGQQIGGLQDVSASKAAGQDQTFTFLGNFAPGPHQVVVTFANNDGTQGDQTNFGRGGDRNVYVDGLAYNGQVVSSGTTPIYSSPLFEPNGPYESGNAIFSINDTTAVPADAPSTPSTTPAAVDVGSGADTLTLSMAEDPFQGDAQFTVAVDGKQVGGTQTTSAVAWQGQSQQFNLHGDWGSGGHTVTVSFVNDAVGSFDSSGLAYDNADRNLYVMGVTYDGAQAGGTPWELASNGSQDFNVPGGGQPGNAVISATTSLSADGVVTPSYAGSSTANSTTGGTASTGSTGSSGTGTDGSTPADTAAITPDSLNAGSGSGSGSPGMSFIPPADATSGTTAGSTTTASGGSSSSTTDPTQGTLPATPSAGDFTTPTPSTSVTAPSDTQAGGHGGWWATHAAAHQVAAGSGGHHHAHG